MSTTPEKLGHDRSSRRDLLCLHVSSPTSLRAFRAPSPHFVCLLVWDSQEESVATVSHVVEQVLESGCVYVCAWGRGCERVHDIFDETLVGNDPDPADDSIVMTTWHADESLEDALWFFLRCTVPQERFEPSCRSSVVILFGSAGEHAVSVRRALAQPEDFARRVEDAGE